MNGAENPACKALFIYRFRALRRHLLEALVLGVIEKADGGAALGDARGLVVGRPRRGAAVARQLVAVGIVGERGADHAAADAHHRVRMRRPGRRIGIAADVGLGDEIAERVVGDVFIILAGLAVILGRSHRRNFSCNAFDLLQLKWSPRRLLLTETLSKLSQ
jgi:hypothetical protein